MQAKRWRVLLARWQRQLQLAWPVSVSTILRTAMRTTDMIVTGRIGPAAVTAVGLGDAYGRVVLRVGQALGTASIAVTAQESGGKGRRELAGEALTQAIVVGFIAGLPFSILGLTAGSWLVRLLGASGGLVVPAALYVAIILSTSPLRITGLIGTKALQGTGNTQVPMRISMVAEIINIFLTVVLTWGVGPFPRWGVAGAAAGTATSDTLVALSYFALFTSGRYGITLRWPRDGINWVLARQLLVISGPQLLSGGIQSAIEFPFNALLLALGTPVAAGYYIARRIQQQVEAPFQRSFGTVASMLTGKNLGRKRAVKAYREGAAIVWLSVAALTGIAIVLLALAVPVTHLFTADTATAARATAFIYILSATAPLFAANSALNGSLRGAGDTVTPLVAASVGRGGFQLIGGYVLAVVLGFGLGGVFAGMAANYVVQFAIIYTSYKRGGWVQKATRMIDERKIAV